LETLIVPLSFVAWLSIGFWFLQRFLRAWNEHPEIVAEATRDETFRHACESYPTLIQALFFVMIVLFWPVFELRRMFDKWRRKK
jgi:hypothetical protein